MTCTLESETTAITPVLKYTYHEYFIPHGPRLESDQFLIGFVEMGAGEWGVGEGGAKNSKHSIHLEFATHTPQENFTHE